ncbi:MAG: WD40 repeat domain-containing protein, partial [Bacteroidales bacterium]|nr:WD40 repeat domain-containing protein [Bacteroidales bacterium]
MKKSVLFVAYLLFTLSNVISQQTEIETVVQTGHYAEITAVAYSNNGKFIVTGSVDKKIILWDAFKFKEIRTFLGCTDNVLHLEFSKNDTLLLATDRSGAASVWNVNTSKQIQKLTLDNDQITHASFSPDNKKIVTASYKSHVRIWNTFTGKLIKTLHAIPQNLYMDKGFTYPNAKSVSFSHDGKHILAGCSDYTAICWNASSGKEVQKYKKTRTTCTTCRIEAVFSPNGEYVATAYDDSVKIFNTKTGLLVKKLFSRSGSMEQIKFSSDGNLIGLVQYNHVYIWNFHKSKLLLDLYDKQKQIEDFDFSADGTKIITGGGNRMADVWEIKTKKHVATLKGYLNDFDERLLNHSYMYWAALINETCLSPDGNYIAVGRTGNNAKIIDFKSGRIHKTLRGHRRMVVSLDFSNDGKFLATGGTDGRAIVWNVESGDSVHVFKYRSPTEIIFSLDISNDGKWLATSDFGGYITIWSLETGQAVRSINAHQGYGSFSIKFGPNGIYILSAGLDRKLKLIELDTGEKIRTFIGHTDLISSINFHPNKKWFITAGWDNTVRVWDFYNGMQVKKIIAHKGGVYDAKFDTSGNYIITGGDDYLSHLWDARTNTRLNTFKGHKGGVGAVNITPDNRFIITGSRDGSIKIWNRELKREIVSRIFINENDWFIRSPEGYFDASQGAFKSISFVKGTQTYSIDQFFNKFYVPGLYIDLLNNTSKRITTSLQQEMEKFPPSSVEIISPEPGKHFDNNNVIFLTKIINNGGGVSDFKVLHNGKRLPINIDDVKKMKKA